MAWEEWGQTEESRNGRGWDEHKAKDLQRQEELVYMLVGGKLNNAPWLDMKPEAGVRDTVQSVIWVRDAAGSIIRCHLCLFLGPP